MASACSFSPNATAWKPTNGCAPNSRKSSPKRFASPRAGRAIYYPTQTIKIISSFGAGGGSDIIARILAQRMQEKLGQNVVVENRPGAGGVLGNEVVANAPKDGYTLGVQTAGQIIASVITKNMRYDAVGAFDWIGQIATAGLFIVVRPDSPYKDIRSLVAFAPPR